MSDGRERVEQGVLSRSVGHVLKISLEYSRINRGGRGFRSRSYGGPAPCQAPAALEVGLGGDQSRAETTSSVTLACRCAYLARRRRRRRTNELLRFRVLVPSARFLSGSPQQFRVRGLIATASLRVRPLRFLELASRSSTALCPSRWSRTYASRRAPLTATHKASLSCRVACPTPHGPSAARTLTADRVGPQVAPEWRHRDLLTVLALAEIRRLRFSRRVLSWTTGRPRRGRRWCIGLRHAPTVLGVGAP
jgi:hypothetical protein